MEDILERVFGGIWKVIFGGIIPQIIFEEKLGMIQQGKLKKKCKKYPKKSSIGSQ